MSGKTDEALLVKEYLERLAAEDEHIEPKVELEAVEEVRILHVLLHDVGVISRDRLDIMRQKDSLALTHAIGFDYHGETRFLIHLAIDWRFTRLSNASMCAKVVTLRCIWRYI